jgi:uncharacterized protein YqjF (DUF2071 family)/predicted DCC family thiol-disulfide oxidoreductase YuxK
MFLSARWHDLVAVTWRVDPALLEPYVPRGTVLDTDGGEAFISLVGFTFACTRFAGVVPTIPTTFPEVNLRFYVRREVDGEVRRAVVFIKEIVPARMIATGARWFYEEPYVRHPMTSRITDDERAYGWSTEEGEHVLAARSDGPWRDLTPGTHAHFILEHYWGYNARRDGRTTEYRVEHPPWRFREATSYTISESIPRSYGAPFAQVMQTPPYSVLVADGSDVRVSKPRTFRAQVDASALPGDAKGYVLYDGACGFCSWWIPFWQDTIRRTGYEIAALQEPWVQRALGLPQEQIASDIRLLMRDGTLWNGADAYLFGMRRVWWSAPVGWLLSMPGLRQLTWRFYRWFNRNRFAVSRMCRLDRVANTPRLDDVDVALRERHRDAVLAELAVDRKPER